MGPALAFPHGLSLHCQTLLFYVLSILASPWSTFLVFPGLELPSDSLSASLFSYIFKKYLLNTYVGQALDIPQLAW